MLGQSQTTPIFFSGQRLEAGTFSFPPLPYTFAVQKRLSDGMKDTEMGSRITGERLGKGMDKEKGMQQVHRNRHKQSVAGRRSVYGISLRIGNVTVGLKVCVYANKTRKGIKKGDFGHPFLCPFETTFFLGIFRYRTFMYH